MDRCFSLSDALKCLDRLAIASTASRIVTKRLTSRQVESLSRSNKKPLKLERQLDSNIEEAQKLIENSLGLKVSIVNKKNNSGKIIVEYKNLDQFELLSKLLRQN